MLMHGARKCPEDILSTDLCPMVMDFGVWIYNHIPYMYYGIYAIDLWSRSKFDSVSETLRNFHVWGFSTNVLEPSFHKTGLKIPRCYLRSWIGFNMIFRSFHSTQVGLVINLLICSIYPHYHVVYDDIFYTVASRTYANPEFWIRLIMSINLSIQVMLYQEDNQ